VNARPHLADLLPTPPDGNGPVVLSANRSGAISGENWQMLPKRSACAHARVMVASKCDTAADVARAMNRSRESHQQIDRLKCLHSWAPRLDLVLPDRQCSPLSYTFYDDHPFRKLYQDALGRLKQPLRGHRR
jgi:hypothetical protein